MSSNVKKKFCKTLLVKKLLSREFRIFRHFVTFFRILAIFRISYLRNQIRFIKTFFTFLNARF